MMHHVSIPALTLLLCLPARAAEQAATAPSPASASNLLQVLFGLVVVLGLMAGAAWILKRMGVAGGGVNNVARVVGGVSVGSRERVVVVEVADQWIVVGVAPGRVNALSSMPRQENVPAMDIPAGGKNFSAWLKQTIEKRNGN
ncbi:MAG TPA: flagellar biosynthetic protein FliO [Noviherbaspirillum sp.]|uniref:flagellar biosynthetic protein FliO n=1 Tax=Noviherbaspirillum sp. TaxID=1926288 RepID=UPI002D468E7D|nr:flagellar biosynthetic protein FliO [Noviherbaspirillum sp.]HYD95694.1 flagellar biosynthetic protein FliO [Noviherbaspirillum sp.]